MGRIKRGELTREQVVAAALACIDRVGLEGFSVREVARALGVFPTALYWHVPGGRNALLAEAAGAALHGVLPEGVPDSAWQAWLLDVFRRYRQAVRRHPNVAPLLGSQLVSNAGVSLDLVEAVLGVLAGAGFTGPALVEAYNVAIAAMLGFTTLEFAPMPRDDLPAWQAALRGRVEAAEGTQLAANRSALANRAFIVRWENGIQAPMDASFEAFAAAVVDGLGTRLRDLCIAESVPGSHMDHRPP